MAHKIAAFINLKESDETKTRLAVLMGNLPNVSVRDIEYGEGDWPRATMNPSDPSEGYKDKAQRLKLSQAEVYFATCWPSLRALNMAGVPTVFGGLVTDSNTALPTNSRGIRAFIIEKLCPNWPNLLYQIAPDIKKVGIVYDSKHTAPSSQYTAISGAIRAEWNWGQVQSIKAAKENGSPNNNIGTDIRDFAQSGTGKKALIVTACTLTGLLREEITNAAKNVITIYPEQMYTRRTTVPGLMSYGPDLLDLYARAAAHIKRFLYDPKHPLDSEVAPPETYKLIINRSAWIAAGLVEANIPHQLRVTFDGAEQNIKTIVD